MGKEIIKILLIGMLSINTILAQSTLSNVDQIKTKQDQTVIDSDLLKRNSNIFYSSAFINQVGVSNEALIRQNIDNNNRYSFSSSSVFQYGNFNKSTITDLGLNNSITISQEGENNISENSLLENKIKTQIEQKGSANKLLQLLSGGGMDYSIKQFGSNNELIQIEKGEQAKGYSVIQRGTGMKVIIVNQK